MSTYRERLLEALIAETRDWIARNASPAIARRWDAEARDIVQVHQSNGDLADVCRRIAHAGSDHVGLLILPERIVQRYAGNWRPLTGRLPALLAAAASGAAPASFGPVAVWAREE